MLACGEFRAARCRICRCIFALSPMALHRLHAATRRHGRARHSREGPSRIRASVLVSLGFASRDSATCLGRVLRARKTHSLAYRRYVTCRLPNPASSDSYFDDDSRAVVTGSLSPKTTSRFSRHARKVTPHSMSTSRHDVPHTCHKSWCPPRWHNRAEQLRDAIDTCGREKSSHIEHLSTNIRITSARTTRKKMHAVE